MKYSQFNNHFFYEQKYIWFNSFSNEFLILEPILHDLLQSSINEKNPLELKKIHQDFYDALLSKKFIVDKFVNEIELVREWNKKLIEDDNFYHITINPTMNCNFKCWYCYETHIKDSKLSDKTIQAICNHINIVFNTYPNLKDFKLSWFGGEPLLYYDTTVKPILEYAYKNFKNTKVNFYSTFTTNGLLINIDRIIDFKKYSVNFLQITLDGFEEEHNNVRYISKNKGSFIQIVDNIILLAKNEINVTVRINFSENTLLNISKLADFFSKIEKKHLKYLLFDFHQVWQEEKDLTLELNTALDYFKSIGLDTVQRDDVDTFKSPCYADKKNHATINYNGEVFKCTARDFKTELKEGDLLDNVIINWNNKYFQRIDSKIKNNPCFTCSILPLCGGGCSQVSLENQDVDYCVKDFDENKKLDIVKNKFQFTLYKSNA